MFIHIFLPSFLFLSFINNVQSISCCNTPYPDVKIWISVSAAGVVNYTFYDIMGQMKKMWAYEVDETATILKDRKIFQADIRSLLCPPGYATESPYHQEMSTSWPRCNMLCLQHNASFKPDKWYVVCRQNSCQSCNLDKMKNTKKRNPDFVKLDSASIVNDTFFARLTILESGMRYNVTLKPGYSQPSVLNTTIKLDEKNLLLELPHVNRTIDARSPFVLNVKPWLKGDTLPCKVEPDFQHFTLYQSHLRRNQN